MGKIQITAYKCERCGHVWVPRKKRKPRVCPKCKSPYWDVPREKVKNSKGKEGKENAGI